MDITYAGETTQYEAQLEKESEALSAFYHVRGLSFPTVLALWSQSEQEEEFPPAAQGLFLKVATARAYLEDVPEEDALRNLQTYIMANWSRVPEVVRVLAISQEENVDLWTIIDTPNKEIRYLIYELERELGLQFPGLGLDFRLTNLVDYPEARIENLDLPDAVILYDKLSLTSNEEAKPVSEYKLSLTTEEARPYPAIEVFGATARYAFYRPAS